MLELTLLPPAEAIKFLAAKGIRPSFSWMDVYAEEHANALAIAKMTNVDLLQWMHDELVKALQNGTTLEEFAQTVTPRLQEAGWWGRQGMVDPQTGQVVSAQLGSPTRLQLIFDMNLRTAYSRGRYERYQAAKATIPYFEYATKRDGRVRPMHRKWDGITLPQDDSWWATHYPPNGWNCRCIVVGATQEEADAMDPAKRTAPNDGYTTWTNPRTGEVRDVPNGVDPGFDYHVGKDSGQHLQQMLKDKTRALEQSLGQPL